MLTPTGVALAAVTFNKLPFAKPKNKVLAECGDFLRCVIAFAPGVAPVMVTAAMVGVAELNAEIRKKSVVEVLPPPLMFAYNTSESESYSVGLIKEPLPFKGLAEVISSKLMVCPVFVR